jgi:stearoyl-CoA desaturase (Delta-9 desaturase)
MTTLENPIPPTASPPADGSAPIDDPPATSRSTLVAQRLVTSLLVIGPGIALGIAVPFAWGNVFHPRDLVIGVVLYLITGHGVTVGYHRLFTHRSFTPKRWLKIALASAGSLAVQGSVIAWVADHRRHHRFSDREGDPHSPHLHGTGIRHQLKGFAHAHVGWLFRFNPTSAERFAPDLIEDRDLVRVSRLFPLFGIASLALPFGLGWVLSGTIAGALTALLWAGGVRMMLLHHVTWSVNSICHMFGKRPFRTREQSRNFAPLAVVSMGESWHNLHHAYPQAARHGALRGQVDSSARLIRWFEQAGWATDVRWPEQQRLVALAADTPRSRTSRHS